MQATPQDCRLRPMIAADINDAVALTRTEGWPHRVEDWAFHLELGAGWVIENAAGQLLGTLLWWDFDTVATLGLIIVDRRCQGQGLGTRLMQHAVTKIGERTLRLVATTAGYELYRRYGFEPVGTIEQRQAKLTGVEALPSDSCDMLRPLARTDADLLSRLDREATGADRTRLLRALLESGEGLVLERAGRCRGFAMIRESGKGQTVGPLVAKNQSEAKLLLSHLLAGRRDIVRIDVPGDAGALATWLDNIGLPVVDQVVAMQNRPPASVPTAESCVFALVSQAFG